MPETPPSAAVQSPLQRECPVAPRRPHGIFYHGGKGIPSKPGVSCHQRAGPVHFKSGPGHCPVGMKIEWKRF
jgi:hypothetical protein